MSVQSVLFVHRPSNCYPLIGNCCHVRPVLPTGHSAVFFLNKGKGIGSLCPYPARREAQAHTSPDAQWESPSGGSGNAAGGMIMPPKGSTQRGDPSGRFFGDFLIGEKVTRVQGGAPAYQGR